MTVTTNAALTGILDPEFVQENAIPGVFNYSPDKLSKWRKALANVRTSQGRARIALIGDSTTQGTSSGGDSQNNCVALSYPTQLATELNAYFAPASSASTWGNYMRSDYDPRVVNVDWTTGSRYAINGATLRSANTVTTAMSFDPGIEWDTAEIWYAQIVGSGTFTIKNDAATTLATVTPGAPAPDNIKKETVTQTLGASKVNIARTTGGTVNIVGIVCYNSAVKKVDVWNWGWHGSTVDSWTLTGNGAYVNSVAVTNNIPVPAADLIVIGLTINDCNTSTALATYKTKLQQIITASLGSDVILMTGVPSSTSLSTVAQQATYDEAVKDLAITNNLPLINLKDRWTDYAVSNALGLYGDTVHPNALGYSDVAQAVARVVGRP